MTLDTKESIARIEDIVTKLEATSSAEIVLVVADSSGSYTDIDLVWSILGVLLALTCVIFSPVNVHPLLVIPIVSCCAFLLWLCSSKFPKMRRLLCGQQRLRLQTERGAKCAFLDEQVSATRERTGVLFYFSLMELELVVLPDLAIDGKVPRSAWNRVIHGVRTASGIAAKEEALLTGLESLKDLLAQSVPAQEDDNPNEIPNRPRFCHN